VDWPFLAYLWDTCQVVLRGVRPRHMPYRRCIWNPTSALHVTARHRVICVWCLGGAFLCVATLSIALVGVTTLGVCVLSVLDPRRDTCLRMNLRYSSGRCQDASCPGFPMRSLFRRRTSGPVTNCVMRLPCVCIGVVLLLILNSTRRYITDFKTLNISCRLLLM
jgi:hypothetical protein